MQTISVFRWSSLVVLSVISVLSSGCEELDRAAGDAPAKPMGTTVVAPTILAPDQSMPKPSSTANNQSTSPADPNAPIATTDSNAPSTLQPGQENDPNIKKAEGTDGVKGSGYGGGVITEPVSQYFRLQNRI